MVSDATAISRHPGIGVWLCAVVVLAGLRVPEGRQFSNSVPSFSEFVWFRGCRRVWSSRSAASRAVPS